MVDTTETISCPECGIPFDTRAELERHGRLIHAVTKEATVKGTMPEREERIQSRTEEKGKGETPESARSET